MGASAPDGLYTRQQVARAAGISYWLVRRWQEIGLLTAEPAAAPVAGVSALRTHLFSERTLRKAVSIASLRRAGVSMQSIVQMLGFISQAGPQPLFVRAGGKPALLLVPPENTDAVLGILEACDVPEGGEEAKQGVDAITESQWSDQFYGSILPENELRRLPMAPRHLNRRDFLRVSGLCATTALAAACTGATPAPAEPAATAVAPAPTATSVPPTATAAPAAKYAEAPSLAARVAAGELPPVDERVSEEPLVVECFEEPGEYSDDLHRALLGPSDMAGHNYVIEENLFRWDYRTGNLEIVPNVAKSWELSEDGLTYTFQLRKGMRWSDGEPFTVDDVLFWYQDIASNAELSPSFPSWLTIGGEPVIVEKVDDYAFTFKFAQPYGILLEAMCVSSGGVYAPRHYLEQFHPAYADPDELAAKVKEASLEYWYQLFAAKNDRNNNPDLPVIGAWKVETPFPGERMVSTRNPYYWKVDSSGKQLPYFERQVNELAQDKEIVLMKALAGEIDLQTRHLTFDNYSLLKEQEESGGYRVFEWENFLLPSVYVNQSYAQDPGLLPLFRTKEFRHALSYGIKRDELNTLFWYGLAEPMNPVAARGDPFWQEGFGQTAIEYDPDKANELLDAVGLDQRDGDGYRLRPDGARLQMVLEYFQDADVNEQVAGHWQELGIDAQPRLVERSLWQVRVDGNEAMLPTYSVALIMWILDPMWYVPWAGRSYWAPGFATWLQTEGESGVEPTDEVKQLVAWYEELRLEPDADKRLELGHKILSHHNEQIYIIGTCRVPIAPLIVKNDIVNALPGGLMDSRARVESLSWPFQLWRRQS